MTTDPNQPTSVLRMGLRKALREAQWQRDNLGAGASNEDAEMAIASIVAEFLYEIPTGIDAGTLYAEVKEISNG